MTNPSHPADGAPAFELKGSALTLMVLHLLDPDPEAVAGQLAAKFGQAPAVLRHAPLVLDLSAVREFPVDIAALLPPLRALGLVPVAARGGSPRQQEAALAAGLGLLPEGRGGRVTEIHAEPAPPPSSPAPVPQPSKPAPAERAPVKVITHPVRSGQRITAEGDLIILSSVGAGSEILAGCNIHVYGALKGRALAGARGDTEARIFCLQFSPELVAIAGEYLVNEEIDPAHLGQQVLVSLEGDRLKVEAFGSHSLR